MSTSGQDVVINGEKHFGLAFGRQRKPQFHRVVGILVEVHWPIPMFHLLQSSLLRTEFVIPDDDDFLHFGAVHAGIAFDVLENELEVLFGIESRSDESEPAIAACLLLRGRVQELLVGQVEGSSL